MSASGTRYWTWAPNVPRIPDDWVKCVVYLYRSVDAAELGEPVGGCGLLVGVESATIPSLAHVYVVTNAHVSEKYRVARHNILGGSQPVDLSQAEWIDHGADVSVCQMGMNAFLDESMKVVSTAALLTENRAREIPLRHGDELFMVSRYVAHEGFYDNEPITRFGTLAKVDPVPVLHEAFGNHLGEYPETSYLAEMRSLPGHSGSPVFAYWTGLQTRLGADEEGEPKPDVCLLGIDWGHPPWPRPVMTSDNRETSYWVGDNSGITCIVPAWKITELLEDETLVKKRRELDEHFAKISPIRAATSDASID